MFRRRGILRLLGFVLIPALSAVSPLLALPAITSVGGASVWGAVAIGQSIGLAGATIVELGWGLNGPQRLARTKGASRRRALALSLQTRLTVFPFVAAIGGTAAGLVSLDHKGLAVAMAVGSTATGLSLVWFFIGSGAPGKLLLTDSVPRLVFVTISAISVLNGAPIVLYPVLGVIVPALIAPLLGAAVARLGVSDFRRVGFRRIVTVIRFQMGAMSGRLVSALYIALPITLVGIVAPQAVPVFAAAERLQRMYLGVLAAIPNALQGWVGKPSVRLERLQRAEASAYGNAVIGAVAGASFAIFSPWASQIVFSGEANVPRSLALMCGGLIFLVCCSRAVGGLVLVSLSRIRVVASSALVGAGVGVPAILVLSNVYGASGGIIGEILAEIGVLAVQISGWLRARNPAIRAWISAIIVRLRLGRVGLWRSSFRGGKR